jgi:hypothetical protein
MKTVGVPSLRGESILGSIAWAFVSAAVAERAELQLIPRETRRVSQDIRQKVRIFQRRVETGGTLIAKT